MSECVHCNQPSEATVCDSCIADGGAGWIRLATDAELAQRGALTPEDAEPTVDELQAIEAEEGEQ